MTNTTWTYQGKYITCLTDLPDSAIGFVYLITTNDGRKYIGKKILFKTVKRKFGKKESALVTDKRKK